jgi:polyferredoxin
MIPNNNGIMFRSLTSRGLAAYVLAVILTALYVIIYFGDRIAGGAAGEWMQSHVYRHFDALSQLLRGRPSDQWFFYGTLYTAAILVFGIRMLYRYRTVPYQIVRTLSVMFFQLIFAYLLPNLLVLFKQPEFYFSYFWPLKPEYLYPQTWARYGKTGTYYLIFAAFLSFAATPVLTYFFGKRWYCSWVCGCGGLANTAGDSFRHLSSKSSAAWKLEQMMIYPILGLIVLITALLWINSLTSGAVFGRFSQSLAEWYGFYIGAIFSGVIGVGFYPLLGTRIWCRFGCPMAAILGILQVKLSRFRITTNGGHCISCGNCSTYCEMGIDVRAYAQNREDIVRASCVGCGICSAVCPRGVLRLESRR